MSDFSTRHGKDASEYGGEVRSVGHIYIPTVQEEHPLLVS